MARALLYKRDVNAILINTHANSTCDEDTRYKIQEGVKIKEEVVEEPIGATLNTNATNSMLVRNDFNSISDESLSDNNVLYKNNNTNSKQNKSLSNRRLASLGNLNKLNLKRKVAETTEEVTCDVSQSKEKRQHYNRISENENMSYTMKLNENESNATTDRFNRKSKHIVSRKRNRKNGLQCKVCFRKFRYLQAYEQHRVYYENIIDSKCNYCTTYCKTREKLSVHMTTCHRINKQINRNVPYELSCNFCTRTYRDKQFLQSHLFHSHYELMLSSKKIKRRNCRTKNHRNKSQQDDTSKANLYEEQHSTNLVKLKEPNMFINNINKFEENDLTTTEKSQNEESSSNEMTPTKKLRQPTLTEYLELRKRKHEDKLNPNKLNMKDDLPNDNGQVESSPTNSSNVPEQIAHSTLKQDGKQLPKKPFVKIHADVEMMKSFLDNLSDPVVKRKVNDIGSSNHREVPYSLRPVRVITFTETSSDSRRNKSKNVFKTQLNTGYNTRTKQNVTDSNVWKSSIKPVQFKLKDCIIPLTRCDAKPRNSHEISTNGTTFERNTSDTVQCNATFQENNIQNKTFLKELEISLERLAIPATNMRKVKTHSNAKKSNDGFSCKVCKKTFSSKLDKHMHIKAHHIAYMSSICTARYKQKYELCQHYLHEHVFKLTECCICYIALPNYEALKQHLNVHCLKYLQRENDQYPIDKEIKCSRNKKANTSSYECPDCSKEFSSVLALISHTNYCTVRKETERNRDDSIQETSESENHTFLKITPQNHQVHHNEDANQILVTCDEETHSDLHEYPNNDSVEESRISELDMNQISEVDEEEHHNENVDPILVIHDEETHSDLHEHPNSDSVEKSQISELDKNQVPEVEEESKIVVNAVNADDNSFIENNLLAVEKIGAANESQDFRELLENNNSTIQHSNIASAPLDAVEANPKIDPCRICGKQFQSRIKLEQHLRIFNGATDVCPMCSTGFSSRRLLQTHITAAHVPQISKTYSFHCMFCNQGFSKKVELRSHVLHLHGRQMLDIVDTRMHNSQPAQETFQDASKSTTYTATTYTATTYTCNVCNLVFESHNRYIEHRMYYYKDHMFTCSLCEKTFRGMYMFHHHNKVVHYSEDLRKAYSYTCEVCYEGFKHESHFYSHNMHVHLNEENLNEESLINITKGSEERSRFDHASAIQQKPREFTNQQEKIETSNNYTCQICQTKCTDADEMQKHEAFYSNDGDYQCPKCSRRCRTFDLLEQHLKLTHVSHDGYLCHVCGEILNTMASLICHEKHFHSNDVDSNCQNCGQTLSSNISRKEHQCKSRNQRNSDKTVTQNYDCLFCDTKFFSIATFQKHITQVHLDSLLVKQPVLKPSIFNNVQKQSTQQLESPSCEKDPLATDNPSTSEDNPSTPEDNPSTSEDNPSTSEDNPSTPEDNPSTPEDNPSTPDNNPLISKDNPSTSKDNPSTSKNNLLSSEDKQSQSVKHSVRIHNLWLKYLVKEKGWKKQMKLNKFGISNNKLSQQIKNKIKTSYARESSRTSSKQTTTAVVSKLTGAAVLSKLTGMKTILPKSSNQAEAILPELSNQAVLSNDKVTHKIIIPASPHINGSEIKIQTSTVSSNKSNVNTLVPVSVESINGPQKSLISAKSVNENKVSSNDSSPSNGPIRVVVVPPYWKANQPTIKKVESMSYTCPLCPLEYPSLIFFHAHLKYAHANFIYSNSVYSQLSRSSQKVRGIECLLCPSIFTDETTYKKHLRNSHTHFVYMPPSMSLSEEKAVTNVSNKNTKDKKKRIVPEIITLDDDDHDVDHNIKNTSDQRAAEVNTIAMRKEQNDKIGKLRVKPFAKIIENLSADHVSKLV